MSREEIPANVQIELVVKNSMTCCICRREKNVHIHHINGDRSDNKLSNLAVVCPNCHSKIHKSGGFTKRYSPELIRKFKDDWESIVAERTDQIRRPSAVDETIEISALLSKVQSHALKTPLSQCIAEALGLDPSNVRLLLG